MVKYVKIDMERLIEKSKYNDNYQLVIPLHLIADLPTANVAPVVHGRWIERQAPHAMGGISAKCSACSKNVQYLGNPLNYCPHCGAKMDGDEKNDD